LKCEAKRKAGGRCNRNAVRGSKTCYWHIPGNAARAGQLGGRRRRIYNSADLATLDVPGNAVELAKFLAITMHETRGGNIDPRVSNAVSQLAGSFLRAIEVGNFEERIAALEKQREAMKGAI
jgi:hypothetical protein